MRVVLVVAALVLLSGCGGSSPTGSTSTEPSSGTVSLDKLCPEIHLAIDALVVSNPDAQRRFVSELERIASAGTSESQAAVAPLLAAGRALQEAGTGPNYFSALERIHPAQVAVDEDCLKAGSPILHEGH